MFCNKCGNIMPDGTKYCSSCGAEQRPHSSAVNDRPQFQHGQPLPSVSFSQAIRLFFSNYANFPADPGEANTGLRVCSCG